MKLIKVVPDPGNPKDFYLVDTLGKVIIDLDAVGYVKKLVIPPAYTNVHINYPGPGGSVPKILFTGTDTAGRRQIIYSKGHRADADKCKFNGLIAFGKALPRILKDINEHAFAKRESKKKLVALILKIITMCHFRVGNIKYQKLYNSFGISNIKKNHVTIEKGSRAQIQFIGKKRVLNTCNITDAMIVSELGKLTQNKQEQDPVFPGITADEINGFLKTYNSSFSTKMFRTFYANLLLIEHFKVHVGAVKRKKVVVEGLKIVSDKINNQPAVCKSSYINAGVIGLFLDDPAKFRRSFDNGKTTRVNFINFLEKD